MADHRKTRTFTFFGGPLHGTTRELDARAWRTLQVTRRNHTTAFVRGGDAAPLDVPWEVGTYDTSWPNFGIWHGIPGQGRAPVKFGAQHVLQDEALRGSRIWLGMMAKLMSEVHQAAHRAQLENPDLFPVFGTSEIIDRYDPNLAAHIFRFSMLLVHLDQDQAYRP